MRTSEFCTVASRNALVLNPVMEHAAKAMIEIFKSVLANLAAVFRHILPGCLVLAFAWTSHPSWFDNVDLKKASHFWLIGGAALLVGNVAYVLHRTIIHQAVDYLVSWRSPKAYVEMVAGMIEKHLALREDVRELMHLKNSQIIVTAMFAELCFAISIWNEPASRASAHHGLLRWLGILLFLLAGLAHGVSHYVAQRLSSEPRG